MFGEFFELLKSEFSLLDALARDNESVVFVGNVGDGQMTACVEDFVRSEVIVGEQLDTRLAVKRFGSGRQQIWMTLWIIFEHVTDLHLARLLGIHGRQIANAMRFDPFQHVTAKVLPINLPVRLQILTSSHEQTRMSSGMTLLKVGLMRRQECTQPMT